MLLPRLITAIIGIPLIILSIYWGGIPFFILMLGVVFLAVQEYFFIVKTAGYTSRPILGSILGICIYISIYLNTTKMGVLADNQGTPLLLTCVLIPLFLAEIIKKDRQKTIESIAITFFGAFFVPWSLGHLLIIRNLKSFGMQFVIYIFVLIWALDTGAMFAGKKFGRIKLAETVSPKKTVEGAVGGSLTAVLVSIICYFIFLKNAFTLKEIIILGFVLSVFAQFSDLCESLLKRDAGVKDSANLLPGHGGMLDRFDSFLFAAPLFYYYLTILKGL